MKNVTVHANHAYRRSGGPRAATMAAQAPPLHFPLLGVNSELLRNEE